MMMVAAQLPLRPALPLSRRNLEGFGHEFPPRASCPAPSSRPDDSCRLRQRPHSRAMAPNTASSRRGDGHHRHPPQANNYSRIEKRLNPGECGVDVVDHLPAWAGARCARGGSTAGCTAINLAADEPAGPLRGTGRSRLDARSPRSSRRARPRVVVSLHDDYCGIAVTPFRVGTGCGSRRSGHYGWVASATSARGTASTLQPFPPHRNRMRRERWQTTNRLSANPTAAGSPRANATKSGLCVAPRHQRRRSARADRALRQRPGDARSRSRKDHAALTDNHRTNERAASCRGGPHEFCDCPGTRAGEAGRGGPRL